MPTLLFPDRDTLRLALASGVVPAAVSGRPARGGFDDQGRLLVAPESPLARETLAGLVRLGVQVLGPDAVGPSDAVASWQQLLPLEPVAFQPGAVAGPVLFELPASRFAGLAGEVRRLGRQPFAF